MNDEQGPACDGGEHETQARQGVSAQDDQDDAGGEERKSRAVHYHLYHHHTHARHDDARAGHPVEDTFIEWKIRAGKEQQQNGNEDPKTDDRQFCHHLRLAAQIEQMKDDIRDDRRPDGDAMNAQCMGVVLVLKDLFQCRWESHLREVGFELFAEGGVDGHAGGIIPEALPVKKSSLRYNRRDVS